ncbi:MAG TPA: hypothetical protein VLD57_03020 [Blastocatellia bacterium]|nr:hypothetical protein [Blastocatellia bacterium]
MVKHLTQKQVEDYCRQQLPVADLPPVSDHLGECETCRRQIEYAMNGDAAFFALRSEVFGEVEGPPQLARAHLTEEQAGRYVDRSLSGEELQMVSDHLTCCEQCAMAVDDLQAFRDQIVPSLEREYHPAPVPSPTEGWWHRMIAPMLVPFQRSPGLAYGAAMAVLLIAATGWLIWRAQQKGPQQEIVVIPPPPPTQPAPAPTPAPAPVVAQLNDGEAQLTLDQEGRLSGAEDLPPDYQARLKEALANGRIETSPHLRGLRRPSSSLMSADDQGNEFSVIEPVGKVIISDRPTFRWSPLKGATGYVVEIYDGDFNLVAASQQLTGISWSAPALSRGRVYAWQVKAIKDGQEITSPRPPAPQARFRVLDAAKANELVKARRAYPSSHLMLGLLYAEAGLLREAEQELRALQKANPDSETARSLLRQIQALQRGNQ